MADNATRLMADIAAFNASEAAFTMNSLLAAERERSTMLADALLRLANGLEKIPDMARTIYIENLLSDVWLETAEARRQHEWFNPPGGAS